MAKGGVGFGGEVREGGGQRMGGQFTERRRAKKRKAIQCGWVEKGDFIQQ